MFKRIRMNHCDATHRSFHVDHVDDAPSRATRQREIGKRAIGRFLIQRRTQLEPGISQELRLAPFDLGSIRRILLAIP